MHILIIISVKKEILYENNSKYLLIESISIIFS